MEEVMFSSPAVCRIAGITYRQLDYWARQGYLGPDRCKGSGGGRQRAFTFGDAVFCRVLAVASLITDNGTRGPGRTGFVFTKAVELYDQVGRVFEGGAFLSGLWCVFGVADVKLVGGPDVPWSAVGEGAMVIPLDQCAVFVRSHLLELAS